MSDAVHIFGIRHHGPGSARSLREALASLQPDCVLVEGPPDADHLLRWAADADMQPPVALLVYTSDEPRMAGYYPLAEYSPEWIAFRHALAAGVPLRQIDLPAACDFGLSRARQAEAENRSDGSDGSDRSNETHESHDYPSPVHRDPLSWLAEASGYSDSERWWEHMIEVRRDHTGAFAAVLEAMATVREAAEQNELPGYGSTEAERHNALREAWMRQCIRTAVREGHERIAVVCGAWHAPALRKMPAAKADAELLKGLPKAKVESTWIPWTYGRLCTDSGYGAGVDSPGWYDHLWRYPDDVTPRWITGVARLLREADLDASSASVIEAVRLAESLAALRDRPLPGLPELNDACLSVFCFGSAAPMKLIERQLIIGERLGSTPAGVPTVPLEQDLAKLAKRLRLPREAAHRDYDLDLRKPGDLERSRLLHRLTLLNIPWGSRQPDRGLGTFHEAWRLQWEPELALSLIQAGIWGGTVVEAATAFARSLAGDAADLPELTELVDGVLLADLPDVVEALIQALESRAAVTSDVGDLMMVLPRLAGMIRYPNVRRTDRGMLEHVAAGMVERICIGLPGACFSLDDDAASLMYDRILSVNAALSLLGHAGHRESWLGAVRSLADTETLHGLIAGRCTWLAIDAGAFDPEEAARRLGRALSPGEDPARAAAWVEGLLRGNADLLIHTDGLLSILDEWVADLPGETFKELLPLVRRTFASFQLPERRAIGEKLRSQGSARAISQLDAPADLDPARAEAALAVVHLLLGIPGVGQEGAG